MSYSSLSAPKAYSETMDFVILTATTLLATCVQGVAGMGFGMVAVPVFVVLIGAHYGIVWGNICGFFVALTLFIVRFRDVNWYRFKWLMLSSLPALIGTAFLLRFVPDRIFSVFVGIIMLVMVFFSLFALRFKPLPVFSSSLIFGFLAGMMSTLVAQSGPVMAAYSQATRWKHREFAATLQPLFLGFNVVVVASKVWFGGQSGALTALPLPVIIAILATILAGTFISRFLVKIIKPQWARNLALALATIGALRVLWGVIFPV